MPPRLHIGAVFGPTPLAVELERAGHLVRPLNPHDAASIDDADLVLLDADEAAVVRAADALKDHARDKQMFLHTALGAGAQLLDDVETTGAIVMCAANLFGNVWVTSAADEVGETIVGLIVTEIGGTNIPIVDTQRPALVAAQRLRALESVLRGDAADILRQALPTFDVFEAEYMAAPSGTAGPIAVEELEWVVSAVEDERVQALIRDVERRRAEQERT